MIDFILAMVLNGYVATSDSEGFIGIRYNVSSKVINIVYENSPCERAGVLPKDKIVSIEPWSGYAGEECILVVQRNGELITFDLTREPRL